ncbi:MAG: hypothetical protein IPK32_06190 [Verrucomicrobiaceae bacterium]|nr:hypothetical protein [Verrucomicrobiaceae bacterium]
MRSLLHIRFGTCLLLMAYVLSFLAAAGADVPVGKVDVTQPGAYRSGDWEFKLIVTSPGSKSEGTIGRLYYKDSPVPDATPGDFYQTPWGDIQWVGNPGKLWGEHGWILRNPLVEKGKRLKPPGNKHAEEPIVMIMVLQDEEFIESKTPAPKLESWILQALPAADKMFVRLPWFALGEQSVTLEDNKLMGTLAVRRLPARSKESLDILISGGEPKRISLPRKNGAVQVIAQEIGLLKPMKLVMAFKVTEAAPDWPAPLVVGIEADGKTIEVINRKQLLLRLPGDKNDGRVWMPMQAEDKVPAQQSIQPEGQAQWEDVDKVFEILFGVSGPGRAEIELEYKRPWQKDVPAEKHFRLTCEVK